MSVPSFDGSGLRTIFPQLSDVQVDTLLADNDFDVARAAAAAVLLLEQKPPAPAPPTSAAEANGVVRDSTAAVKQESWTDRFGSWLSVLVAEEDDDEILDFAPVAWTPCEVRGDEALDMWAHALGYRCLLM